MAKKEEYKESKYKGEKMEDLSTPFHVHNGANQPKTNFTDINYNLPILDTAPTSVAPDGKMKLFDDGASPGLYIMIKGTWVKIGGGGGIEEFLYVPFTTDQVNQATISLRYTHVVADMLDTVTNSVFVSFYVPTGKTISSIKFIWECTAAAGDLCWNMYLSAGSDGEAVNTHSAASVAQTTTTIGASKFNYTDSGLDLSAVTATDKVGLEFNRLGGSVNDTLNRLVYFNGFLVTFA